MSGAKIALITGCSRGIGLGLVKEYVSKGYQVLATCRNPENAPALKEFLAESGQKPAISLDVSCASSIQAKITISLQPQKTRYIVKNYSLNSENSSILKEPCFPYFDSTLTNSCN